MSDPIPFATRDDLRAWLAANGGTETELWVLMYKVKTGRPSVTWEDCVLAALEHGWIDGQSKPIDEASFKQRLTPRRKGSGWSQRNRVHVENLIAAGRMTLAGLAQVNAAKADGRWDAAYAGPAGAVIPDDFLAAVAETPGAQAAFDILSKTGRYTIYYQLHTAKTEKTRAARMAKLLAGLVPPA
jgi:uncharacterized protein YdeI (YjbR/CyaY-like superfamily)